MPALPQPPAPSTAKHPLITGQGPVGVMTGEGPRYPSDPGGHEGLKRELQGMGARYEETWGKYEGHPERSLIIHGLPREQLYGLGQKYGQESVIHGENGKHEFMYTNGPQQGTMHHSIPANTKHWEEGHPSPPDDDWTKVPGQGHVRLDFDWPNSHVITPSAQTPQQLPITKHEIGHSLYLALSRSNNLHKQENMSEDKKLSVPMALHELHKSLTDRIGAYEQKCLDLRKAELAKSFPHKGDPKKAEIGDGGLSDPSTEKGHSFTKNALSDGGAGGPSGVGHMAMSEELCKACGLKKGADHDCDVAEKYAKGEMKKEDPSSDGMSMSEDEKLDKYAKMGKEEIQPAGSAPSAPDKKVGVLPEDKKSKKIDGLDEGSGGQIKKSLKKAGATGAAPSAPKAPSLGKPAGMPKLPAPGKVAAPKTPAMGAGTPAPGTPALKSELTKGVLPPTIPGGQKAPAAMIAKDKAKLPGVRQSVSNTMDSMLAAPPMTKPFVGSTLPASPGAVVSGPMLPGSSFKAPAKAQTMVERVASRVPASHVGQPLSKPPGAAVLPGAHLFSGKPAMGKAELKKDLTPSGGNSPTGLGNTSTSSISGSPYQAPSAMSTTGGGGPSPQAPVAPLGGAATSAPKTGLGGVGRV